MSNGGAKPYTEQVFEDPADVLGHIRVHPVYLRDPSARDLIKDDLGFPRIDKNPPHIKRGGTWVEVRERQAANATTFEDLRNGLWEILYRLRLFPEAGVIPAIDTESLSRQDVEQYIFKYGEQLLNILGERHIRQIAREDQALEDGAKRYRDNAQERMDRGHASETRAGTDIIDHLVKRMAPMVFESVSEAKRGKPGIHHIAAAVLQYVSAEVASYITIKLALDTTLHRDPTKHGTATLTHNISNAILQELQFNPVCYEDNPYCKKLLEKRAEVERRKTRGYKKTLNRINEKLEKRRQLSKAALEANDPRLLLHEAADIARTCGHAVRDAIGGFLINALLAASETPGIIAKYHEPIFESKQGGKDPSKIVIADWAVQAFNNGHAVYALQHPMIRPMLTFPVPWTLAAEHGGIHAGGYRGRVREAWRQRRVIKTDEEEQIDNLSRVFLEKHSPASRALHGLQNVAFKINQKVLAVAEALQDTDTFSDLGPRDRPDFESKTKAEKKTVWSKWYTSEQWKRAARMNTLKEASADRNEAAIFFPHKLDYRGRVYAKGANLDPQGDDLSKGLLEFAEGKAFGSQEAVDALAVHGANCYENGIDKKPLKERIQWVHDHSKEIQAIATSEWPEGFSLWKEAGNKWQFLAFCYDWAGYCDKGLSHVSHLPIYVDGTCNGYQHMAALMRDRELGSRVNMAPHPEDGKDIYEAVVTEIENVVRRNAQAGEERAAFILQVIDALPKGEKGIQFNRDLAKKPVMTFGYGATIPGIKNSLVQKLEADHDAGKIPDAQWQLLTETVSIYNEEAGESFDVPKLESFCSELATSAKEAIKTAMSGAYEARTQLERVGKVLAGVGSNGGRIQSIDYVSPSGFPMRTVKYEEEVYTSDIRAFEKRLRITLRKDKEENGKKLIKPDKTAAAFPPNLIHSLDAAHLAITIDRCLEQRIRSFVTTHDCFGCLAADMPMLAKTLRQSFVDMYNNLDMKTLTHELATTHGIDPTEFEDIPIQGDLDLHYVLESETFFS